MILVPGFVSHVELAWEEPPAHFGQHGRFLASVLFDKRGTGMSDPVESPPSMGQRMDDIRAVMDAVGVKRSALFGISRGHSPRCSLMITRAAEALILYGSGPAASLALTPVRPSAISLRT